VGTPDLSMLEAGIGTLNPNAFERFCYRLVAAEALARHNGPAIDPPAPPSVADGGGDIKLECARKPFKDRAAFQQAESLRPLTEDPPPDGPVRTVYSCKTTKKWLTDVLTDIKKGGRRAHDVLDGGGHFKVFVNVAVQGDKETLGERPGSKKKVKGTAVDHIAAWFASTLKNTKDLSKRIEILDANALGMFARHFSGAPKILDEFGTDLGVKEVLVGLDEWRRIHDGERGEPTFEPDLRRTDVGKAIASWIRQPWSSSLGTTGWLVGAPGVGKTRLVIETLQDAEFSGRVRVSVSPGEAAQAIDDGLLVRRPNSIVVVDDCPPNEVSTIAVKFRAKNAPNARLLVLTPYSPKHAESNDKLPNRWDLEPLDEASVRRIIATELAKPPNDPEVAKIGEYADGYPWFAVLLAKEALAQGRAPSDMRQAVEWALVPKAEAQGQALAHQQLQRARALLAAMLAWDTDWDLELDDAGRTALAKAVQLSSWEALRDDAHAAEKRGLLRLRDRWKYKYVTPQILEREIINWLLGDGGPDGGGRNLQRHGKPYVEALVERLDRLGLSKTTLDTIAKTAVEALAAQPQDWDTFANGPVRGATLLFACEHDPLSVATLLHERIQNTPLEELAHRTDLRRDLVFALNQLAGTRLGFDLAEAALFRLANAENESYVNNASGVWSTLFLLELNETYRDAVSRMTLLEQRCHEGEPRARAVALLGIKAMFSTTIVRERKLLDGGAWSKPSPAEAHDTRARAVRLLGAVCMDRELSVATRARDLMTRELRDFIRSGVGEAALASARACVSAFGDSERGALAEKLAEIRQYDMPFMSPAATSTLEAIEKDLAPTTFAERLHRSVGGWGPAATRLDDGPDVELAAEGLSGESPPIASELDWLLSDAAKRARSFAWTLGKVDKELRFFDALRARQAESRGLLAAYLGGRNSIDTAGANRALSVLRGSAETSVLVACVMTIGANDETCNWVATALRAGQWRASECRGYSRPQWLRAVSDAAAADLYDALISDEADGAAIALDALSDRIENASLAPFQDLAVRALGVHRVLGLGGLVEHHWARVAMALLGEKRVGEVAIAAVKAISDRGGALHEAWRVLSQAATDDREATWRAIAATLERKNSEAAHLLLAFRYHRGSVELPSESVLEWVGMDQQRGRGVVQLVSPRSQELNPILRALVIRFGVGSSVASEISARLHSTERAVSSLAQYDEQSLAVVRNWMTDDDANVKAFAERMVASLEESRDKHAAYEEHERRRFGT
jgi:hypothetical protein